MGRPRKLNPSIPGHIDQARLPAGIYWDGSGRGRWYARGASGWETVAGPAAKLSDLHAIAEARAGRAAAGTLERLVQAYEGSLSFAGLAARTQTDYRAYARQILAHKLTTGQTMAGLQVRLIQPPAIRRLIDTIGAKHPTKANHWLRYLRRLFGWGIEFGECRENPCKGVKQLREVADPRMPERATFRAVQAFAAERGALPGRAAGSVAPYLAPVMEIAYQVRLRGIEAITLTDAHLRGDVLVTARRKGSRDNETEIGDRLRAALDALQERRRAIWTAQRLPTPLDPASRPLVVSERGQMLTRTAWDNAWQRLMRLAVAEGVITRTQRFGLHGLKHRGVTDTEGGLDAKQQASGHKDPRMVHRYDHSLPRVSATDDPGKSTS